MTTLESKINELAAAILRGGMKAPKTGTFNPALVVGIGGTGLMAVRCLKHHLMQHQVNEVRILGIDSNATENSRHTEQLPSLSDDELVILDQNAAVNSLERAANNVASDQHILKFLPATHGTDRAIHQDVRKRISSQRGAGQFRRAGKLLFVANVESGARLDETFANIKEKTNSLAVSLRRIQLGYAVEVGVRIFVVCSLAGGQGAGALLDCLALLRQHFSGSRDQITAICLLPGPLIDRVLQDPVQERPQTRSNAIGALRELQAFLLAQVPKPEFSFSKSNKFNLETKGGLVDQVFLLDHSTLDRHSASNQIDLARAMGFFLYAFLGSGVGADKEVGAINSDREDASAQAGKEIPQVFGSFGVAAMEYPTEAIARYGLRASLAAWLEELRARAMDKKSVETAVNQLLTDAKLRSSDELISIIRPEISEIKFFATSGQETQLVSKWDAEFFAAVNQTRENLTSDLIRYDKEIAELAGKVCSGFRSQVQAETLKQLQGEKGGIPAAKHFIETLEERLTALANASAEEARKRPEQLRRLDDDLKGKAGWIRRVPVVDKSIKRGYVAKFREFLRLKVVDHLDSSAARVLGSAQSAVGHIKADLAAFERHLVLLADENQKALTRITDAPDVSCFLQSRIAHKDLPEWVRPHFVKVPGNVKITDLTEEALITTPLNAIVNGYKSLIASLDLTQDLRQEPDALQTAISSLEAASQPLMTLVGSAPKVQDLRPLKFVAGAVATGDSVVTKFKKVSASDIKAIGTGDPHRLICLQAIQGFGAAHWSRFEEANMHYREREWRSHTLPDAEELPLLKALTEDRSRAMRDLGLAMAFGFVDIRQPNHYRNLVWSEVEKCHYFLAYTAEPGSGAKALIDAGLVKMPSQSSARRTKNSPDFLGGSLEVALEKLQSASEAEFAALMHDVLGDLSAKEGKSKLAGMVSGFIEAKLDGMIADAHSSPDRQGILRGIQQALRGYVAGLK
jgi:hypothetical protein